MADREVLTDDQISALVASAREGGAPALTTSSKGRRRRRVREIDFSRPTKFTQEQQRRLERAHDNFCRMAATRLSAEMRLPVEVQVIGIDQLTWSSAIADIPDPSISAIVEMEPLGTKVLMSLELGLVMRLIDRLLGGEGHARPRPTGLTEIEITLARRLFAGLLDQLSVTWDEVAGVRLSMHELELKPGNQHLAPLSEPTLRLTLEVKIDRFSSAFSLTIPYRSIEPIAGKLQGAQLGEQAPDALSQEMMRAAMAWVEVEVRAEAASIDLEIDELLAIEAGTVLPLGPAAGATLYVGAVPLYRVRPGRNASRRAVEVLEPLQEAS
jgi:flagellar motor switch protein FliM